MTGIGYVNGGAPDSALKSIDGTHVTPDVYERVTALQTYAATVGRQVHVIRLGGYTNLAEQKARQTGSNKASTVPVALAGHSTHGIYSPGRVDLGSSVTSYTAEWLAWLLTVAESFGLVREWPGPPVTSLYDPNHFIASKPINHAGPPARKKEPTMRIIALKSISAVFKIEEGDLRYLPVETQNGQPWAQYAALGALYSGQLNPTDAEWLGADVLSDDDFSRTLYLYQLENYASAQGIAQIKATVQGAPQYGHIFKGSQPATAPAGAIDYAALAKAVNDDAAKRMQA